MSAGESADGSAVASARRPRGRMDKREAILEAALRVFSREGYEGASVDMIATEAGVAKPTIYNHLGGKENLFRQVMIDAARASAARVRAALDRFPVDPADRRELRAELLAVTPALVECFHDQESWAMQRLLHAESVRFPDLYATVREQGAHQLTDGLAGRLARLSNAGHLRIEDPDRAAGQFVALTTYELAALTELGNRPVDEARLEEAIVAGVDVFLRAYAPERAS